ncbi:hypothetical protein N9Z18_00370 [Verrucomicrobiales bacterium]|nr:hypothetical protein [Verrucomicrobiales bacterium]
MSETKLRRTVAGASCLIGIAWVGFVVYTNGVSEFPSEKRMIFLACLFALIAAIPGIIFSYYGILLWQEAQVLWCLRIVSTAVTVVVFFFISYIADYLTEHLNFDQWSVQLGIFVDVLIIGALYFFGFEKICAAIGLGQLLVNQIIPRWFVGILMLQLASAFSSVGQILCGEGGLPGTPPGVMFLISFGPIILGVGGYQFIVNRWCLKKNGPHWSFQLTK